MDSLGLTWTHLDSLELTWTHLVSLGLPGTHLDALHCNSYVFKDNNQYSLLSTGVLRPVPGAASTALPWGCLRTGICRWAREGTLAFPCVHGCTARTIQSVHCVTVMPFKYRDGSRRFSSRELAGGRLEYLSGCGTLGALSPMPGWRTLVVADGVEVLSGKNKN